MHPGFFFEICAKLCNLLNFRAYYTLRETVNLTFYESVGKVMKSGRRYIASKSGSQPRKAVELASKQPVPDGG
jgi:hypothetical protein